MRSIILSQNMVHCGDLVNVIMNQTSCFLVLNTQMNMTFCCLETNTEVVGLLLPPSSRWQFLSEKSEGTDFLGKAG